MDNNPKNEVERLSKENFNLKLRLHYFEQQYGAGGEMFDKQKNEEEERQINYRVLLEEAKMVVAGLQEDLTSSRSKNERLEAENRRLEYHAQRLEEQVKAEEEKRLNAERYIENQRIDYENALSKAQSDRIVEVGSMRDKLAKEQEIRLRAEEDALKHRSEVDALENERRSLAWENIQVQNQLTKAEEELRTLRAAVDKLENEKKRGEWQTATNTSDLTKLQADLRHWKYEAERLESEKRRGDWKTSSSADTSRAEDEARMWRAEAERLEAEKRQGGWQNLAANEIAKLQEELQYWRAEAERLRVSNTPGKSLSDELSKWQSFARSVTGGSSDLVTFMAQVRALEHQRKRVDDSKTWEVFAESLTGSRSIEALEAYIGDLQSRFERLAKRVEFQQQQKPANLQRVQQAEEKLRAATERLEKMENARKERVDEYVRKIADLEEENRRLVKELTDLKFEKSTSTIRPPPNARRPLSTMQAPSPAFTRRGSRLDDIALGAMQDLNYAASLMRRSKDL